MKKSADRWRSRLPKKNKMSVRVKCKCGHVFTADAGGTEVICPACGSRGSTKGTRANSYDVFLSYASQDKSAADKVCAALEGSGLRCWIAPRDIVPGADWSEAIIDSVGYSRSVVLILTEHSNSSPQVQREVKQAVDRKIPILPLRLQEVAISKSLSYFLSCHHWLDALTPPLEQHLPTLSVAVLRLLAGQTAAAREKTDSKAVPVVAPSRRRALWAVAMALVPVIALVAWSIWPEKPEQIPDPPKDTPPPKSTEPSSLKDPLLPGYVQLMRKRFLAFDRSNDKLIGPGEFKQLGPEASPAAKLERFNRLDADRSGWLDLPEFLGTCRQSVIDRDKDQDGRLSELEFSATDAALFGVHPNPNRAPIPFAKYDFDADSTVTLEELERGWALYHVD